MSGALKRRERLHDLHLLQTAKPAEQTPQPGNEFHVPEDIVVSRMIVENIPQLQANPQQLAAMLQNPALPPAVRQQTEAQQHQLHMELAHAQGIAATLAAAEELAAHTMQSLSMPGAAPPAFGSAGAWGAGGRE